MRIAIYVRVSTKDQNAQQQEEYLQKWAIIQGYSVVKSVVDTQSATLPIEKRKKFKELINEVRLPNPPFDALCVFSLDRLTRNWYDVNFIEKIFRLNWDKCRLISSSQEVDLLTQVGLYNFRIAMIMSCNMPEDMLEKQVIGIARAKQEGKYKGGKKGRSWAKKR